jgi:hypothetical protein
LVHEKLYQSVHQWLYSRLAGTSIGYKHLDGGEKGEKIAAAAMWKNAKR